MDPDADNLSVALVQLAADYIRRPCDNHREEKFAVAVKNAACFGRILSILEAFIRSPIDNSASISLSDSLSPLLPSRSLGTCLSMLQELKSEMHKDSSFHCNHFPTVAQVRWRVDVTISSSVLSRVLEPTIIMELNLSDGQKLTFELSISKFHKLRYTVASILKEMDSLSGKMNAIKV